MSPNIAIFLLLVSSSPNFKTDVVDNVYACITWEQSGIKGKMFESKYSFPKLQLRRGCLAVWIGELVSVVKGAGENLVDEVNILDVTILTSWSLATAFSCKPVVKNIISKARQVTIDMKTEK
jgi:hypothetical protein